MTLRPLSFLQMGQYDYFYEVQVSPLGELVVRRGSYASQTPRYGQLSVEQVTDLAHMVEKLPPPQTFPHPDEADGFSATLSVGESEWCWWFQETDTAVFELVHWLKAL